MNLETPIEEIAGIGPVFQKRLKKLGIKNVQDLIYHFPHRYEDFSNLKKISEIKTGEKVCLLGKILEIENSRTWKKKMVLTEAIVDDGSGSIKVVWFNQPYLINVLKRGDFVCLAGKVSFNKYGLYLSSPAYEKIQHFKSQTSNLIHTGRLVPIYPETEGLSSRWLRFVIRSILLKLKNKIEDPLPEIVRRKNHLLPIREAIWQIHFPDSLKLAKRARERFSFENLFYIELYVLKERYHLKKERAISIPLNLEILQEFIKSLPFDLTPAQKRSLFQILKDLEKPRPMNRLLEGDVGSGKTIVALISAFNVIKAGYQVAFMVPTEILAKQHFKVANELFKKFKINVGLLTKNEKPKKEVDLLIGTHALIQDKVKFKNLALVILDEQHRFGVEQRAKLCQQPGFIPHLLSMTATPIPRTLALTLYGDLDLSIIDQLPKKRKVITKIIPPEKRLAAYQFIRKEIERGKQAFVICPRIEPGIKNSSQIEVRAVKEEYEKLSKIIFPDLKIGYLHGKMKSEEKEKIMEEFKKGEIDILVSTSVVEVGIDIPNATIIMIEGAERFGLAQLHQFRGRIGRGGERGFCFLFTESSAKKTMQRLNALTSSEDGFKLAQKDLEIRGPGEIFGKRQWGVPDLAMDALKDIFLVEKTRNAAKEILEKDPELKNYPLLRKKIAQFEINIHLE
jgi:ATP-dependent DNA helicase RecG